MTAIGLNMLSALGQPESAALVQELLGRFSPVERQDDPPWRHYLNAPHCGLSFLFDNDHLIDIQIYAKPTKTFAACPYVLPLGLKSGMKQSDVHELLGEPEAGNAIKSRYVLGEYGARLHVAYDQEGVVRHLSLAPASGLGQQLGTPAL